VVKKEKNVGEWGKWGLVGGGVGGGGGGGGGDGGPKPRCDRFWIYGGEGGGVLLV